MIRAHVVIAAVVVGCSSTSSETAGDTGGADSAAGDVGGVDSTAGGDTSREDTAADAPTSGSGTFTCGSGTCSAATEECCLDDSVTPSAAACVARGTCTKRVIACVGAANCSSGQVCCGKLVPITSTSSGFAIKCATECASDERQFCATSAECKTSGATCTGTALKQCTAADAGPDASDASSDG